MHKYLLIIFIIFFASCTSYKRLHHSSIVADTHNDVLTSVFGDGYAFDQDLRGKAHTDVKRLKEGGVDVQIFSVWSDGKEKNSFNYANQQIDTLLSTFSRNPEHMVLVKNSTQIREAIRQNKIASMIGVEGGHMIEDDLNKLKALHDRGVIYLTLTWNNSTSWATSARDETTPASLEGRNAGLTEHGKNIVKKMNELGMLVDVSHVGEKTFWDAINTTTKPVIASHSCVHALCPVPRNLKDDQIKAIGKNGGVIFLNFYSGFIDPAFEKRRNEFNTKHKAEIDSLKKINPEPYYYETVLFNKYPAEVAALRPPLSALIDHLDYIVKLIGVDHVGLGSDFDGVSSTPKGLDDVTQFPLITKELLKRGYKKNEIKKILGENFLRVVGENEKE